MNRASLFLAISLALPGVARAQAAGEILELSLDEAVERALKNNADLAVEKFSPELSAEDERGAKGAYDPLLQGSLDRRSQTEPSRSAFTGGAKVESNAWNWNFSGTQLLPTGARFGVDFTNGQTKTNNVFSSFNPSYGSNLTLSLNQPLFRNREIDGARQQLKVSKNNRAISDTQFRQSVVNTIANVKKAYYDIIAAIDNLGAKRQSLELAKKLLNENQIKVRVGTLAPLDIVSAESEVARREEDVIVAEALVAQTEDTLKAAIFPRNDPVTWALRIAPKDRPNAERREVDVDSAIRTALEKRTDIQVARKRLETSDVVLRFARSQRLPAVDLVASYGGTGQGGTQRLDAAGQPLATPIVGGYGEALGDVFGREFPNWSLGLNLSYPLFNRQARAGAARAQLSKEQALASLNRLELQIAQEVRSVGRNVETNFKRVQSTRAARVLQERRLDAEEKKFAAGMSTNFLVTQAQRDLADAQVAEIRAILDYQNSLIDFDRVQEAGLGSGVVFASSGSSGSSGQ